MSLSEYSCKICSSEVKDTNATVLCYLCGKWIYTDCASIGETQQENLKENPVPWYCPYSIMELPFFKVRNNDLQKLLSDSHNNHPKPIPRKMNKKTKELLKKFCEMSQPGFNMEQTPTEPSAGGTLIYISQNLSYKLRKDLQIYCPKELESTFIELLISNLQSHLIGVVYKHPSMKHYKFNNNFMNTLLEKLR